ncbi:hypothetical protein Ahy_A05g022196 isoform A [Arachis hypogaea]|uniref:Uncharacterized protein n=1 Tax=Arachis hypogaea TaxID=3818 RepID=A0A445D010_ARAHY|nr:hypothetical protein Ahy_A05g022196 isoform A [Arachis hypogaea]
MNLSWTIRDLEADARVLNIWNYVLSLFVSSIVVLCIVGGYEIVSEVGKGDNGVLIEKPEKSKNKNREDASLTFRQQKDKA